MAVELDKAEKDSRVSFFEDRFRFELELTPQQESQLLEIVVSNNTRHTDSEGKVDTIQARRASFLAASEQKLVLRPYDIAIAAAYVEFRREQREANQSQN